MKRIRATSPSWSEQWLPETGPWPRAYFGLKAMIPMLPVITVTTVLQQGWKTAEANGGRGGAVPPLEKLLKEGFSSGIRFWVPLAAGASLFYGAEFMFRDIFPGPKVDTVDTRIHGGVDVPKGMVEDVPGPSTGSRSSAGALAAIVASTALTTASKSAVRRPLGATLISITSTAALGAIAGLLVPSFETAEANRAKIRIGSS